MVKTIHQALRYPYIVKYQFKWLTNNKNYANSCLQMIFNRMAVINMWEIRGLILKEKAKI